MWGILVILEWYFIILIYLLRVLILVVRLFLNVLKIMMLVKVNWNISKKDCKC